MKGEVIFYCNQCEPEIRRPVANVREAMISLVGSGRYGDLDREFVHECSDGGFGIAELAEGVPEATEEDCKV